jgi:hypothetical protein
MTDMANLLWLPQTSGDREATHLRLLVEASDGLASTELALRRLVAERLGSDALGREWQVSRLFQPFAGPQDDELARFFEVTGAIVATPTYPLQKLAFDLARGLADGGPYTVDPDLPSSAYGFVDRLIDPTRRLRAQTPGTPEALADTTSQYWALDNIRARAAWALVPPSGGAARGAGIRVGHPDTGYTLHPELEVSALDLANDRDLIDNDDNALDPLVKRWWFPLDTPGHGTHTGSVIAGRSSGQISGVAPESTLVPIRTVKTVVQVFDGDVAKAVYHAYQVGCHVISMSLGGIGFIGLQAAIAQAVANGVIVVAAVGQDVGFVVAPAVYPECIGVAASTADDQPWSRSSHGPAVDICAPGESIWVANVNTDVSPPVFDVNQDHKGTSFAAAHLGGVAALWLAHHGYPALISRYGAANLQAVFMQLLKSAGYRRPPGWNTSEYGAGIVDAEALLNASLPPTAPAPPSMARFFSAIDRLQTVVPELKREELTKRLVELFNVDHARLDMQLDRYGRELVYLLSEDRELREQFISETVQTRLAAPSLPTLRTRIASAASKSLAEEVLAT